MEKLVSDHHEVYVSVPEDEYTSELESTGVRIIHNDRLERRGTNPLKDLKLFKYYKNILKEIMPDVVFTYTIKPNVYGGYACGRLKIPYIVNVTGLGTAVQNGGLMQKITLLLYKIGIKKAKRVFFQNEENLKFMISHNTVRREQTGLLPGSGVNTDQHCYEPYPENDDHIIFTTVGRIMKDKGIDEILNAAEIIRAKYPQTEFRLIGDYDEKYEETVKQYESRGVIRYLGFQKDVHPYMAESHAIIHASYHEGMSNILQEASSTGRPVIATDVHGCIEIIDPGVTGLVFKVKNADSLAETIEKFINMPHEEKENMGKAGREKMIREFSRKIVIEKYINEISEIKEGN